MANYCSFTRTEKTFSVIDPEAFEKELIELGVLKDDWEGGLMFCREEDGTYWLGGYDCELTVWRDEADDYMDIVPIVQKHMRPDAIWTVVGVGNEKLSFVGGWAEVITKTRREGKTLESLVQEMVIAILIPQDSRFQLLSPPNEKETVQQVV